MNINSCLFCGKNHRYTSEHIIQRGFGSNWTLPSDVCSICNSELFSSWDKSLIDFAHLFIYPFHPDILQTQMLPRRTFLQLGNSIYFDNDSGLWLSVRMNAGLRPVLLQQIILTGENGLHLVFDSTSKTDWQFQFAQMKRELSKPDNISLKQRIINQGDNSLPMVQTALIRSSPNSYLIRASSQEESDRLKQLVLTGQLLVNLAELSEPKRKAQQPFIQARLSINFNDIERALAKSAVNVACACLGSDRAREPALDPIKSFILGETSYVEGEFVGHCWRADEDLGNLPQTMFSKADNHTIMLSSVGSGVPTVAFSFYQSPFALVKLTEAKDFMNERDTTIVFINYKHKTHEIYRVRDNITTFAELLFNQ